MIIEVYSSYHHQKRMKKKLNLYEGLSQNAKFRVKMTLLVKKKKENKRKKKKKKKRGF